MSLPDQARAAEQQRQYPVSLVADQLTPADFRAAGRGPGAFGEVAAASNIPAAHWAAG
jgi:hypothetical protein